MKKLLFFIFINLNFVYAQEPSRLTYLYNQGDSLMDIKEYETAIPYFTDAIDISLENTDVRIMSYSQRAYCKLMLSDFRGCIIDATQVINNTEKIKSVLIHLLDMEKFKKNQRAEAYTTRGYAKYGLHDMEAACLDLSKAGDNGAKVYEFIQQYCK